LSGAGVGGLVGLATADVVGVSRRLAVEVVGVRRLAAEVVFSSWLPGVCSVVGVSRRLRVVGDA